MFGTRSDATATLQIVFVDVSRRLITQDPTRMRTKNSKSQITFWFPVDDMIREILIRWIDELRELGCHPNHALFPPDQALASPRLLMKPGRLPIKPWLTDASVRCAFKRICEIAQVAHYSPHTAKHYLGWMRDEVCRTSEQRRAWSQNLGHENEITTELHYRKVTEERQRSIFDNLYRGNFETDEEKDLMLLYHESRLTPGTPEYIHADRLYEARRAKYRPG